MSDLIDRQAAIDVLEERLQANGYSNVALVSELNRSIGYLMQLPSVQPEIVRCKDCKHLFDGEYNANCCEVLMGRAKWLTEITVDMNWYCADRERRTDE